MSRILIESARCDVGGDVFCPVVIAEARLCPEDGAPFYLSAAEVEGVVQFYRTADSTFEQQLCPDDPAETGRFLEKHLLWAGEYDALFAAEDPAWFPLFRYLVYLLRSDWEDCETFAAETAGRYLDELAVPMSDAEEMYRAESGEDAE